MSRLQSMRRKLDALRDLDPHGDVFGAERHRHRLNPPLTAELVRAFEDEFGAPLPPDYAAFVTQLGDGGAGPGYGVHTLAEIAAGLRAIEEDCVGHGEPFRRLDDPFPFTAEHAKSFEGRWREASGLAPPDGDTYNVPGALVLGTYGCANDAYLVVTGDLRGTVWRTDGYTFHPCAADPNRLDFLSWYEAWLDHWLAPGAIDEWAHALRRSRTRPPPQVYVVEGTLVGTEIHEFRPAPDATREPRG